MTRLNQIIAVEKGVKARAHKEFTDSYQLLQKPPLLQGISRTYQPRDEDGEQLPAEQTRVQIQTEDVVVQARHVLSELFDVTATKDWANCTAKADIVVDGTTILSDVPATYLLFLEKQLDDIRTFVSKLPVLDPAEEWMRDPNTGIFRTEVTQTFRTKKIPRNHVKAEATKEHAAQVDVYFEDVAVGTWNTVRYSGALPATRVRELTERVEKLQQAVKYAREQANMSETEQQKVADAIFGYLFA